MHALNIMSAVIGGFSNRNEKAIEHLDDYAQLFEAKDQVIEQLESAAEFVLRLGLRTKSYWLNKANIFSLIVALVNLQKEKRSLDPQMVRKALEGFEAELPEDYKLAATEAVNSTRNRLTRNKYLTEVMFSSITR